MTEEIIEINKLGTCRSCEAQNVYRNFVGLSGYCKGCYKHFAKDKLINYLKTTNQYSEEKYRSGSYDWKE